MPEIAVPAAFALRPPAISTRVDDKWASWKIMERIRNDGPPSELVKAAEEDVRAVRCVNGTRLMFIFRHIPTGEIRELREQLAITRLGTGVHERVYSNGTVAERQKLVIAMQRAFQEAQVTTPELILDENSAPRAIWDYFARIVEDNDNIVDDKHPLESRMMECAFDDGTILKFEYQDLSPKEASTRFRKENVRIRNADGVILRHGAGGVATPVTDVLQEFAQKVL